MFFGSRYPGGKICIYPCRTYDDLGGGCFLGGGRGAGYLAAILYINMLHAP